LSSNGADDEAKLEALKYLGHWVGERANCASVVAEGGRQARAYA
jgi:hypothetical protein